MLTGRRNSHWGRPEPVLIDSGTLDEDRWWDADAYEEGEIVRSRKSSQKTLHRIWPSFGTIRSKTIWIT